MLLSVLTKGILRWSIERSFRKAIFSLIPNSLSLSYVVGYVRGYFWLLIAKEGFCLGPRNYIPLLLDAVSRILADSVPCSRAKCFLTKWYHHLILGSVISNWPRSFSPFQLQPILLLSPISLLVQIEQLDCSPTFSSTLLHDGLQPQARSSHFCLIFTRNINWKTPKSMSCHQNIGQ